MGLTGGCLLGQDDIRWLLRGSLEQPARRDRCPAARLKLEPAKASVRVLVIDHAEMSSEN
jgi:hypothetical protein